MDDEGGVVDSGTFAGTGQLTTARVTTDLGLLGGIGVRLNPVDVGFYVDEANRAFMLSDIPLSQDRLSVVVDFSLLGISHSPVTVPLNNIGGTLAGIPVLGGILGPVTTAVTNLVQRTLNEAVLNLNYNPNDTLALDDAEVVPCFLGGTMILTIDGLVAVEDLEAGALVVTRDNGY